MTPTPSVIMQTARTRRLLLAILLVIAVLGMHGLATSHHAGGAAHPASSPTTHLMADVDAHHAAMPMTAAVMASHVVAPAAPGMTDATAMCLAVLTAGLALALALFGLLLRRRPAWLRAPSSTDPTTTPRPGPPGLLRLSLAMLCVLRT